MDELPESLLLQILSRLDDSSDVARCRVASKAFNAVFPGLRSINLRCTMKWYANSTSGSSSSHHVKPFKEVFLELISKLTIVESVLIVAIVPGVDTKSDDLYLTDGDFAKEWVPRVSGSLKSLSIYGLPHHRQRPSDFLPLISAYCHNLVELLLTFARLSVENLIPMPMLTSLTLKYTDLEDEHLNVLNKCFPNLLVLNIVSVRGLQDPKIHLLKLQTLHLDVYNPPSSLTIITPNLITLRIECDHPAAIHLEAPMLSHFHINLSTLKHAGAFTAKRFKRLKTLWLESLYVGPLLKEFPTTYTVEHLTLESGDVAPRYAIDLKLTLTKVFMVFPNVSYLQIKSDTWSELEACLNLEDWDVLDGKKGLKTICAYLKLVDPLLTFSYVSCVLDQCVGLSEVSLFIHRDVVDTKSKSFMSKCMARWPGLKWRWGLWGGLGMEDSWITDGVSN